VDQLLKAGSQSSNVKTYQFWRHDNKPIELWSNQEIDEKLNYVHNNPVEEGVVFRAEDYLYSSATDYAGEKGLLNNVIVIECYHAMQSRGSEEAQDEEVRLGEILRGIRNKEGHGCGEDGRCCQRIITKVRT